MYATFLASLNDSVLLWHYRLTSYRNLNKHMNLTTVSLDEIYSMTTSSNDDKMRYNALHQLAMIYITLYSSACSLKELLKLFIQPKAYLTDFTSYLGTGLFLSALRFSILALSPSYKSDILFEFQCGCISLFLAWLNLLLFMQSILMMMGDWNYVENFAKPYYYKTLVYPHLTYGFLLTFVILMPILFINLLIGLAVGDIEIVQKDASLKRLAMQVQYHTELENRMPNRLLRRFQKKELIKYPNGRGTGEGKLQFLRTLVKKHLLSDDKRAGDHAPGQNQDENDRIMQEMDKTKSSMNEMKQKIDRMSDLLQTLIGRMGIEMDEEELRISENRRHSNVSLMQAQ
uniref:Transient receptor potential cation channel subfamily A member 1 n=1 Tax=Romanomermis culicivorax TaxID=13658 RepID=A0A915HKV2_ROMCU